MTMRPTRGGRLALSGALALTLALALPLPVGAQ